MKKIRIQLSEMELRTLRNLLAAHYYDDRRNLRYERERLKRGEPDSQIYPVGEQEKHLKEEAKLLRKLCRPLKDEKWFIR